MRNIKVELKLTSSKILAFLILIIGTVYTFIYKDSSVLTAAFLAAGTVMAIKTGFSEYEKIKTNGKKG